jgi:hypothetical protein
MHEHAAPPMLYTSAYHRREIKASRQFRMTERIDGVIELSLVTLCKPLNNLAAIC